MKKFKDITGKKFNRLTAIKSIKREGSNYYWLFRCSCGKEKLIQKGSVVNGIVKSCGCKKKEFLIKMNTKHGMCGSRFYLSWFAMKQRCLNKKVKNYKNYGGRGITVCDRWLDFENFRDNMYQSYLDHVKKFGEKQTTIERIDNNGNYCLNNCKWATKIEQANNNSRNRIITHNKETMTVAQWANKLNINYGTLSHRINQYGWSIEKSLTK